MVKSRVCPVSMAGSLENRLRKWVQNPRKILGPYVREGMTVLDFGCGPGYFTLPMAEMVGESGRVIAADLQEGMLAKIRDKIAGTELRRRIVLRTYTGNEALSEQVDFILAFYVVHEIPDQEAFFRHMASILRPGARLLLVEPPFHVSKEAFEKTVERAGLAGFKPVERPVLLLSKAVVLERD